MNTEKNNSEINQDPCEDAILDNENLPDPSEKEIETETLLSLIKNCELLIEASFTENEPTQSYLIKEKKRKLFRKIFQRIKAEDSEELYEPLIKLCLKNKRITEVLQILLEKISLLAVLSEKKSETYEKLLFRLFALVSPDEIRDYEDSLFIMSDFVTRTSENFQLIFKLLEYSTANGVYAVFPVFSLSLRKICKYQRINDSKLLLNYLLHYSMELSTCGINFLLETLSRHEQIEEAQSIFDQLLEYKPTHLFPLEILAKCHFVKLVMSSGVNIVSWGVMIKCLCKNNLMELSLFYYQLLKSQKMISDEVIFNMLIDGCSKTSNLDQMKSIYFDMRSLNITPSIVTFNTIIDAYIRAKETEAAWKIFDDLTSKGIKPDNFTFSTLFRGIRNRSHKVFLERALETLERLKGVEESSIDIILINVLLDCCISMKEESLLVSLFDQVRKGLYPGVKPDIITYNTFIKGCAQMNLFENALQAYELMLESKELQPNDVFFNTMIDVFVRSNDMARVWEVIEKMKEVGVKPDNFTYSTIIKGLNKNTNFNSEKNQEEGNHQFSELEMAFKLFENVKRISKPDEILYNCLMDACLRFDQIDRMLQLFKEMQEENVKPSSITCGIIIKAFGKKGNLTKALEVYEQMKKDGIEVTSVTYGCLINACIQNENLQKAFMFYEEIGNKNVEMNTVLYTTLIKAYSKNRELEKVLEIFNQMKRDKNNSPNNVTYNSVLDCCVKCGELKLAEKIFEELLTTRVKPDIITFSTMIKGLLKFADLKKAVDYLTMMEKYNVKPDEVLLNSLLDGCEKLKKYSKAVEIFSYVRKFKVEPSVMAFSIMMKIYGKLNDFDSSKKLMEEVKSKNKNLSLIIFTCYMKTCLSTKNYDHALEIYRQLKEYKLSPDSITYSTLISGLLFNFQEKFAPYIIEIIKSSLEQNVMLGDKIYSDVLKKLDKTQHAEEIVSLLEEYDLYSGKNYKYNHNYEKKPQGNYNYLMNNYKHKNSSGKKTYPNMEALADKPTPLSNIKDTIKKISNINTTNNFSGELFNKSSNYTISLTDKSDMSTKKNDNSSHSNLSNYSNNSNSQNWKNTNTQSNYKISTSTNVKFFQNGKDSSLDNSASISSAGVRRSNPNETSYKKDQPVKYKKFNRF